MEGLPRNHGGGLLFLLSVCGTLQSCRRRHHAGGRGVVFSQELCRQGATRFFAAVQSRFSPRGCVQSLEAHLRSRLQARLASVESEHSAGGSRRRVWSGALHPAGDRGSARVFLRFARPGVVPVITSKNTLQPSTVYVVAVLWSCPR